MDIIKGRTTTIICTFYSNWTGDASTSTPANLTGATCKLFAKLVDSDSDAAALFTKTGTITDAVNGVCSFTVAASDTSSVTQRTLVMEAVAKLSDGSYIGNGVEPLNLKPSTMKTLF